MNISLEETLKNFGAVLNGPVLFNDSIQRFNHVDDRPGAKNIWVRTFHDGGALYGWHKEGIDHHYQPAKAPMSKREYAEAQRKAREARSKAQAAKRQAEYQASQRAFKIWNEASPEVNVYETCLAAKGVGAYGVRQQGSSVIIPLCDAQGHLYSIQSLLKGGGKMLLAGGRKKGCFFAIPGEGLFDFITEGYTTGASVHEATGCTVIVAVDAFNIVPVLEAYTDDTSRLVMAADNDIGKDVNTGLSVAERVQERYAIPYVLPQLNGRKADWNDVHCERGLAEVNRQIEEGLMS